MGCDFIDPFPVRRNVALEHAIASIELQRDSYFSLWQESSARLLTEQAAHEETRERAFRAEVERDQALLRSEALGRRLAELGSPMPWLVPEVAQRASNAQQEGLADRLQEGIERTERMIDDIDKAKKVTKEIMDLRFDV